MSKDASPADLAEPSGARVARRISVVLPRVNVLKTVTRSFSAEYRNALERVEQMAEVQDQLEQFLEGIEPRVLAITQMK